MLSFFRRISIEVFKEPGKKHTPSCPALLLKFYNVWLFFSRGNCFLYFFDYAFCFFLVKEKSQTSMSTLTSILRLILPIPIIFQIPHFTPKNG